MLTPSNAHHTGTLPDAGTPPGRPGRARPRREAPLLRAARRLPRDALRPLQPWDVDPGTGSPGGATSAPAPPAGRRSGRSAPGGKPADVPARPLPPPRLRRRPTWSPSPPPGRAATATSGRPAARRVGPPLPAKGLRPPARGPPRRRRPAGRHARARSRRLRPLARVRSGTGSGAPAPGGGWAWWPKRPAGRGAVVSPPGPPGPPGPPAGRPPPPRRPAGPATDALLGLAVGVAPRSEEAHRRGLDEAARRPPHRGPRLEHRPAHLGHAREALAAVAAPRPGRRRDPPGGAQRPAGRRRRPLRRRLHRRDRPRRRRRSWPTWGPCTPR